MSSLMCSSVHDGCSKSKPNGLRLTGSSLRSWRDDKYGWQSASSTADRFRSIITEFGGKVNQKKKKTKQQPVVRVIPHENMSSFLVPVMRLLGSKTSIFSSRSKAPGDILGNLVENCCFRHCGSCLTYLRALSLRRNPRLASSGEPISFRRKIKYSAHVWCYAST